MLIQQYAIIAGGFITASSLRLLTPTIKGKLGEWKVQSMLSGIKVTVLNAVIIADDRGLTQIDHLVLTPSGVVILETKNSIAGHSMIVSPPTVAAIYRRKEKRDTQPVRSELPPPQST